MLNQSQLIRVVALTRFKRTLLSARLLVRSLTHTLHLPPAHAELYDGPHAEWLRDILERLPNLQSLIVKGLPFFDHAALQALRSDRPKLQSINGHLESTNTSIMSTQAPPAPLPTFGLRLLDASQCINVTPHALAQALKRFDSLMYLDLSYTNAARDAAVLSVLRYFHGLQILRLRGLNLKDEDLNVLTQAIGVRVRSLDLRDNGITDRGVRMLVDRCFLLRRGYREEGRSAISPSERSPALLPYLGTEMLGIYQGEDFEGYLHDAFTSSFVSRLAIEDAPEGGITHLYIANNHLTVEGLSGLIRCGRLHVLDAGTVESGLPRQISLSDADERDFNYSLPGVAKLTPVLYGHAADHMSFLRVDHSIITKDAPNAHPEEIVEGRAELCGTCIPDLPRDAFELEDSAAVFEMPAQQTPRYELEADPMQVVASPATDDLLASSSAEGIPGVQARRGSAFAPEVATGTFSPADSAFTETGCTALINPVSPYNDFFISPRLPRSGTLPTLPDGLSGRPRSYSSAVTERKARLNAYTSQKHNLHPAMLPHLSTLVLTAVPTSTPDKETSERLIQFIKLCAEESSLAKQQAKLDWSLPPGRKGQASALRQSAHKIFALKQLVLEMAPAGSGRLHEKASPWQHNSTRSMTEDRDSEALWSAAETDFSFFGKGEECGLPRRESGLSATLGLFDEKEVNLDQAPEAQQIPMQKEHESDCLYDTVSVLSAFRKERKACWQTTKDSNVRDVEIDGYWPGLVRVVWRSVSVNRMGEIGEMDHYGNRFSR